MTDRYTRSTDGNNADDGLSWANAKATVVGNSSIDVAGDTIYVSDNHSESTAADISISLAGGLSTGTTKLLCVDDTGDPSPPTALATTAIVTSTGGNTLSISGTAYIYGFTFNCGTGATSGINLSLGHL